MYSKIIFLFALPIIAACTGSKPVPFKLGKDACDNCKMTIMSKNYGLQWITAKGKIFKFDDISCGVSYFKKNGADGQVYVPDHLNGDFIEAEKAAFLKSSANRTPMNSTIVALSTKDAAEKLKKTKGGEILTWTQVKDLY